MLFPTLGFGIFFLVVFAVAWELRGSPETRKAFLIAVSYVFYGCWDWRFTALLATSSLINYAAGRLLAVTVSDKGRRQLVAIAIALNLGILGFFKYYGFFLELVVRHADQRRARARPAVARYPPADRHLLLHLPWHLLHGRRLSRQDPGRRALRSTCCSTSRSSRISWPGRSCAPRDFLPQLKPDPVPTGRWSADGIVLIVLAACSRRW